MASNTVHFTATVTEFKEAIDQLSLLCEKLPKGFPEILDSFISSINGFTEALCVLNSDAVAAAGASTVLINIQPSAFMLELMATIPAWNGERSILEELAIRHNLKISNGGDDARHL